ncbi:3'-5' exonuclease [Xenorhabdus bovienii]|uniref:3'-5' exonuclease n=1 Tax=Xenorhabdus bovienii TaxID=40576 RepID=UPI003DA59826
MNENLSELFISVDIETSGPVPSIYSMLSLGACVVGATNISFYRELKPTSMKNDPEAVAVTGLDLSYLMNNGYDPQLAIEEFSNWVYLQCDNKYKPVFVGFNVSFDWSFINYYFHYYGIENPFGYTALDIKSFFMAVHKTNWNNSRSSQAAKFYGILPKSKHNALDDAIFQADIFYALNHNKEG